MRAPAPWSHDVARQRRRVILARIVTGLAGLMLLLMVATLLRAGS